MACNFWFFATDSPLSWQPLLTCTANSTARLLHVYASDGSLFP